MKKGVLRNFTKFAGKHLYQSLFFNKVADLRPVKKEQAFQIKFIKKEQALPCEFCKNFKNTFFKEHLSTTAS